VRTKHLEQDLRILGDRGAMRSEERGVTIHMGGNRTQLVAAGAAMTGLIMKRRLTGYFWQAVEDLKACTLGEEHRGAREITEERGAMMGMSTD